MAVIFFLVLKHHSKKSFESKTWPISKGIITYNKVNAYSIKNSGVTGSPKIIVNTLMIKFEYEVGNKKYESSNIQFLRGKKNSYSAEQYIGKRYPEWLSLDVYYNPNNPAEACLIPGISAGALVGFLITVFFMFCGVIWLINV